MAELNEKMLGLGENRSVIREIFEFGNKRKRNRAMFELMNLHLCLQMKYHANLH